MKRFILTILLLVCALVPAARAQRPSPATSLSTLKETFSTFAETLKSAEAGNADAQFRLGELYCNGVLSFRKNMTDALKWYTLAAKQGNAEAQFKVGELYYNGYDRLDDYVRQNKSEAIKWFKMAADQGNAGAQYNLGRMYYDGDSVPEDKTAALEWFRKAAEQGDKYSGYFVKAEQGDAEAQAELGDLYFDIGAQPKDNGEPIGWWKLKNRGVEWFRKAAEQGNARAQRKMGWFYYGFGENFVQRDRAEAARWYTLAAEQGDVSAQFALALMYDRGNVTAGDNNAALKWFHAAAKQGHKNAATFVAALQGDADAQARLGNQFSLGPTTTEFPRDDAQAVRWYKTAAEQGHAEAQGRLGDMYRRGEGGLPMDKAEAVTWYTSAASHGCARCALELSRMYYEGKEVERSYLLAVQWFYTAVANGDREAVRKLKDICGWAGLIDILIALFYVSVRWNQPGGNEPATSENQSGRFTRRQSTLVLFSLLCFIVGAYLLSSLNLVGWVYFPLGILLLILAFPRPCGLGAAALLAFVLVVAGILSIIS
ncbi:MAG: sel1 repeat family protein [Methylobacteriaceae bacterium]|nr:sel1 repeat family protein [Methylobacteriaceae bacterium]